MRHDTLQDSDVVLITRSIFKEVHCQVCVVYLFMRVCCVCLCVYSWHSSDISCTQSLQYDDRHCVFNIFLELLTDHMSGGWGQEGRKRQP